MKTKPVRFSKLIHWLLLVMAGVLLGAGCASTRHTEQTEQRLSQAGFKRVVASSEKQLKHLQTLPVDKLTVAKLNGKTFYVFPDPARNQIYVGNLQAYQTYQQIVLDDKIEAQSRVMADLGEDTGDDEVHWVEWSNNTGWTSGSD